MILHINWETTYRYTQPVRQLHSEICMLPGTRTGGQRLVRGQLSIDPGTEPRAFSDVFGNTVHHLDFLEPVTGLNVSVHAEVETSASPEPDRRIPPLLERLYLQSTHRAPTDHQAIAAIMSDFRWAETADLSAARLNEFLRNRFAFQVGATGVAATAVDFVEVGAGVCQDYAHLMLAILRSRGIPARYVSGYLADAGGDPDADASHAWVQVLIDGAWHGFDPANGMPQDERYAITAVGRDYDDIPPVRGTYRGAASEEWTTSVRIVALPERDERPEPEHVEAQRAERRRGNAPR